MSYICICRKINDSTFIDIVDNSKTFDEILSKIEVDNQQKRCCNRCIETMKDKFNERKCNS